MNTARKKTRLFFHVLEHHDYGDVGHQGYYYTIAEAQKEADRLKSLFPHLDYTIWQDTSRAEPPIVTL
jgi:hypothetical protein